MSPALRMIFLTALCIKHCPFLEAHPCKMCKKEHFGCCTLILTHNLTSQESLCKRYKKELVNLGASLCWGFVLEHNQTDQASSRTEGLDDKHLRSENFTHHNATEQLNLYCATRTQNKHKEETQRMGILQFFNKEGSTVQGDRRVRKSLFHA